MSKAHLDALCCRMTLELVADATNWPASRLLQFFWSRVRKIENQCWTWLGARNNKGYGSMKCNSVAIYAHRFAYIVRHGEIDETLVIDHLCRNPSCVNPDHLELVTARENWRRGISMTAELARQTHCKHGHDLSDPKNCYMRLQKNGTYSRQCRTCGMARTIAVQRSTAWKDANRERLRRKQQSYKAKPEIRAKYNELARRAYTRKKEAHAE